MIVTVTVIVSSVGAGEPVGDLDDDDAGVGPSLPAPQPGVSKSGALAKVEDAAVGDAEQVVVDAGGVVVGGHDGVGERTDPSASEAA